METREKLFFNMMTKMQYAGLRGFEALQNLCILQEECIKEYQLPMTTENLSNIVDNVSLQLFPEKDQFCSGFQPVRVYGDGNCLPRTGSLYAFGDEHHHNEIRCRIVLEMCVNIKFYTLKENKVYAQYSQEYDPGKTMNNDEFIKVFKRTVVSFANPGAWGENVACSCLRLSIGEKSLFNLLRHYWYKEG